MKFLIIFSFFHLVIGFDYTNTLGNNYGKDWIFFPDGDGYPHFVNLTYQETPVVQSRSKYINEIEYRLYTRQNTEVYELLSPTAEVVNEICEKGCFKRNAPVKLVTHGWMSAADKSAVMLIKDAYLKNHDVNVIGVDWSDISVSYAYPMVALKTSEVGKSVGIFLEKLVKRYGISGDQIHLIGHSLGAHVMGNAAAFTKFDISRITGLDPARPMFEFPQRDPSVRLDPGDAQFVDVIHTCAGVLGVLDPVGHVDFYPNNGFPPQPGCQGMQPLLEACSHGRAHMYFAEAIESPQGFQAYHCNNWDQFITGKCKEETVFMGENVNRTLRGTFYLVTNPQQPFGQNFAQEILDIE